MAAPKKGNQDLKIRVQVAVYEQLVAIASQRGVISANVLAALFIEEKLRETTSPAPVSTEKPTPAKPEIDLRELLLAAHRDLSEAHRANAEAVRTIAEQARSISALTQSVQNFTSVTQRGNRTDLTLPPTQRAKAAPQGASGSLLG